MPGLGQAVGVGVAGPHLSLRIFSPRNDRWSPAAAASLPSSCSLSRGDRRPFPTKVSYESPRTLLLSHVHSPPDLGSQGPGCSDWPALGHPLSAWRSAPGSSGIDSRVLPQRKTPEGTEFSRNAYNAYVCQFTIQRAKLGELPSSGSGNAT